MNHLSLAEGKKAKKANIEACKKLKNVFIVSKIAQNTDQMCQSTIVYFGDFQSLSKKHKSFEHML